MRRWRSWAVVSGRSAGDARYRFRLVAIRGGLGCACCIPRRLSHKPRALEKSTAAAREASSRPRQPAVSTDLARSVRPSGWTIRQRRSADEALCNSHHAKTVGYRCSTEDQPQRLESRRTASRTPARPTSRPGSGRVRSRRRSRSSSNRGGPCIPAASVRRSDRGGAEVSAISSRSRRSACARVSHAGRRGTREGKADARAPGYVAHAPGASGSSLPSSSSARAASRPPSRGLPACRGH
jgi:hypothetical protein